MDAKKQKELVVGTSTGDGSDNDYDDVDPLSPLSAMLNDLNTFVESGGETTSLGVDDSAASTSPEAKFGASSYKDVGIIIFT